MDVNGPDSSSPVESPPPRLFQSTSRRSTSAFRSHCLGRKESPEPDGGSSYDLFVSSSRTALDRDHHRSRHAAPSSAHSHTLHQYDHYFSFIISHSLFPLLIIQSRITEMNRITVATFNIINIDINKYEIYKLGFRSIPAILEGFSGIFQGFYWNFQGFLSRFEKIL